MDEDQADLGVGVGAEVTGPRATSEDWKKALEKVVPCCVVLKVTQTRPVDTEAACSSYATGFVVDKVRGIILTNRHVVTPGPIVAEAIFLNREETPVWPLYYDPVHDFAFLRFDPSKLQYMEVMEVPLAPEAACVGLDIRVVGNDSGEKVSILAGTLARLDRDAPAYTRKGYNDFNTFYLQAASGTKGGSSGSPVIDCEGRAVGLNAGGRNKAASAFYLPLERVVRALGLIQASKDPASPWPQWAAPAIPRGDLQTTFVFKGFDEVRRLGLRPATEKAVRASKARSHGAPGATPTKTTGMLVVEGVVPGSPADPYLEAGDVLVGVEGKIVTHFLQLEEILDDAVARARAAGNPAAGTVKLSLERGGKPIEASLPVTDLQTVTPSSFLEVAGGSVHALSYQQARNNRAVVGQVYVAETGYMLGRASVPKHAIITSLNGQPTPDLETFARVLRALPHGARVPLEHFTFSERHRRKNAILHVDRQWYGPPIYWTRDDAAGLWHPTSNWPPGTCSPPSVGPALQPPPLELPPPVDAAGAPAPAAAGAAANGNGVAAMATDDEDRPSQASGAEDAEEEEATVSGNETELETRLRSCLALVDVDIPLVSLSDGVHARSFAGNGVVVYHGQRLGLVLVDRNTVAIGPCDVNLSFGAHPAEIPGTVRFLHPLHNFALISYEPGALPEEARSKVRAAELLPHPPMKRGAHAVLAGLTKFLRLMQRKSVVTNACSALTIPSAEVPRFRAVHEEVIKLDQDFGATFSGALTDEQGRVRALWGSYAEQVDKEEREWCAGLPCDVFYPWVQKLIRLEENPHTPPPRISVLDAELEPLLLSKAAQFGLPPEWVSRLDRLDPERRQVLRVRSCVANSHAGTVLACGDMILAVAGCPVTCYRDVESAIMSVSDADNEAVAAVAVVAAAAAASSADANGDADAGPPPAKALKTDSMQSPKPAGPGVANGPPQALALAASGSSSSSQAANVTTDASCASAAAPAVASSSLSPSPSPRSLPMTIFRSGSIQEVSVQLACEDGLGTGRLVHWCGAQLQAPHRAVRELGFVPQQAGVYISRWHHGSPAHRYGLYALHWILEVNGQKTLDLESFLNSVKDLKDGDFVRVKVCHLETTLFKVLTLKMDLKYWPSWELRLDPTTCKWNRVDISAPIA